MKGREGTRHTVWQNKLQAYKFPIVFDCKFIGTCSRYDSSCLTIIYILIFETLRILGPFTSEIAWKRMLILYVRCKKSTIDAFRSRVRFRKSIILVSFLVNIIAQKIVSMPPNLIFPSSSKHSSSLIFVAFRSYVAIVFALKCFDCIATKEGFMTVFDYFMVTDYKYLKSV